MCADVSPGRNLPPGDVDVDAPSIQARLVTCSGRVQGVGYRPFVYRTALELGIHGWVLNGSGKVFIHAEGSPDNLDAFEAALVHQAPPLAMARISESVATDPIRPASFQIRESEAADNPEIHIPPDLFTCVDCVDELLQAGEQRHHYPFINCTNCGPRYTIITAMPYDRPNTSMADFPLCDHCRSEYESPLDRRFHAQPLACPVCGPALSFATEDDRLDNTDKALDRAIDTLHAGGIVAVKGVGGYHLLCDAANDAAVTTLRARKKRPHKPLAVMFPLQGLDGLDAVRQHTRPAPEEAAAVIDPARPIVLLRQRSDSGLSVGLAPGLGELGVFLPYSPLHHLLLRAFGRPVVATSGNISGEPVITDNREAELRLGPVADGFLQHNRPIVRPADDPVVRQIAGRARLMRPGRGIAPIELELELDHALATPLIATGGHMKNTLALAWENRVVVSPHIGDLDSPRSQDVFERTIADLQHLYNVTAKRIVCDAHPGYASSRWARAQNMPVEAVQHHHAHASSLAGEHPDVKHWLVFTWDGVGYGSDGSMWGGEALSGGPGNWQRVASFRPFHLLGGDRAGREPWRSAAALMWAEGVDWTAPVEAAGLARDAWQRRITTFETTAVGRLFDAASALILDRSVASFEGQGPMELEAIAVPGSDPLRLPLICDQNGILRSDWGPLLPVISDHGLEPAERAGIFHQSMAQALVDQALELARNRRFDAIGLSGGVFQNRLLVETVLAKLAGHGIDVRLHQQLPANDGGLCYGQVIETLARDREDVSHTENSE